MVERLKALFNIHSLHAITYGQSKNKIHCVADLLNEVNSKGLFDTSLNDIACRAEQKYDKISSHMFNLLMMLAYM